MATTKAPTEIITALRAIKPHALRSEKRKVPEAVVELVAPDIAKKYLVANLHNRDLRAGRVQGHANTLRRGEWRVTPNGIGFDIEGRLIDGQHRLSAIVVADIPAPLIVARGLPPEAQDVTDQNLPRRASDALKLRGEKDWFGLAAALGWLYRLDFIERTGEVHYNSRNGESRPNTPQLLTLLDKNPHIRACLARTPRVRAEVPLRTGLFAALWLKMIYADAAQADHFVNALATGAIQYEGDAEPVSLQQGDPINALRRALTQRVLREKTKFPEYIEAALISKAWSLWIDGQTIGTLKWNYGGIHRDAFPIIRGPATAG